MNNLFIIEQESMVELLIKKSKFIGFSFKVCSETDVEKNLTNLKEKYFDATHICYAYDLMNNKQKCFDDGEPQGTAGKPILDCLQKQNIKNCMIVVVRYFGGIKLGAGGLTRAYSNSASQTLKYSKKTEIIECIKLKFEINLNEVNIIKSICKDSQIKYSNIDFNNTIYVEIVIDTISQQVFATTLENALNRNINFIETEKVYY